MTRIKAITEKALEESLEALQMEREQKHAIRKELDYRLNSESMYQLSTLQHDLRSSAPEPPSPRVSVWQLLVKNFRNIIFLLYAFLTAGGN